MARMDKNNESKNKELPDGFHLSFRILSFLVLLSLPIIGITIMDVPEKDLSEYPYPVFKLNVINTYILIVAITVLITAYIDFFFEDRSDQWRKLRKAPFEKIVPYIHFAFIFLIFIAIFYFIDSVSQNGIETSLDIIYSGIILASSFLFYGISKGSKWINDKFI